MKLEEFARESRATHRGDKSGIPIVGLEHLIPQEIKFSEYDVDTENTFTKAFKKGQILFGRRRAYLKKAAIADFDGICSGDITVIEAIPGKVDPLLLPFIIQNEKFFDYAVSRSAGGLSPRVKWEHLKDYEFPLPPFEEQRVLADKLWAAYRLKESYKKLLTATQEMVKSQFIEMFGDPNKGNWTASVADYCYILGGFAFKSDLFSSTGVPIVRISNINDGVVDIDQSINYGYDFWVSNPSYRVLDGDILMAMSGATTGKVGVFRQNVPALLNQRVACIRQKEGKSVSSFLYAALQSEFMYKTIQSSAQGGAQPNISSKQISKLPMPAANILDQKKFESIAQQADKSGFELRKSIEAIDQVIKSLINDIK